ncbi:MAG: phage baseplate assembly protein [Betaproteobacteria bacterium]|nr:phage baseplate assembly protein [Betaproteobacteria bacterium]
MSEVRLWRRIWNAIGFGALSLIDDTGPVQLAQVKLNTPEIRDGVPVVQLFGLSGNAPVNSNAVLLFLGGDRSNAIVVATNNQGSRPRNQNPGESTLYNNFGMSVALTENGIVINGGGMPVTVTNGDLHVVGAVIAGYGTADQVGVQSHLHDQEPDSAGDVQKPTNAPTAGT